MAWSLTALEYNLLGLEALDLVSLPMACEQTPSLERDMMSAMQLCKFVVGEWMNITDTI